MAKPFVPPFVYHNGTHIFFEWPDHVQRLPYNVAGLAKALALIPHVAAQPGYVSGKSNVADIVLAQPKIKIARKTLTQRAMAKVKASVSVKASASAAIRNMKPKVG